MFSVSRLFRKEAYARRGQGEAIDGLLTVSAPHERMALLGVGLALLAVLAWALLGSLERRVSAQCVLQYQGERNTVVAESSARVIAVLVDAGDRVEEGQLLAKVRTLDSEERAAIVRAVVSALAAQSGEATDGRLLELEELLPPDTFIVSPRAGEIAERFIAPGDVVQAGSAVAVVLEGPEREFEVAALVSPEDARRIDIGMQAYALPSSFGSAGDQRLEAVVAEVSVNSAVPSALLTNEGAPSNGSLVRLTLQRQQESGLRDYEPCNLNIVLGRSSPLGLLISSATG